MNEELSKSIEILSKLLFRENYNSRVAGVGMVFTHICHH